jgi:hypothetical protein
MWAASLGLIRESLRPKCYNLPAWHGDPVECHPMRVPTADLRPHPQSPCKAVRRISVGIGAGAAPGVLQLRYRVDGDIGRLALPTTDFARRSDGLWQHTCFEAFLRPDASESYHEFNFAPSGDWAAYRFSTRRSDRSLPELPAPLVRFHSARELCDLSADIHISALPELATARVIDAGMAAVVESLEGGLTWWALSHGAEKPDFHDPATFLLQVTAQ